jgi:membrane-bound lytic murein transglycosylase B
VSEKYSRSSFANPKFLANHKSHIANVGLLLLVAGLSAVALAKAERQDPAVPERPPFSVWLADVVRDAKTEFSDDLVTRTLSGLEPLERVIREDRSQAELVVGFERYYRSRVNARVVQRGRDAARQNGTLLSRIETQYDVQRRFLVAIWGIETQYGRVMGRTPVFQALATLAWEGRREQFFKGELFDALRMVERGHIDAGTMTGSWAGAMGHPQFMPSSYLKFAQDFDRDGRRDIWRNTGDALASIASYLQGFDWTNEETWGREVRVSDAVRARVEQDVTRRTQGCFAMRNMTERMPLARWQELGVRRVDGAALPRADVDAGLVLTDTRAFLVYSNYDAILAYNCAHYYALTVALLSDQLR